MLVCYVLRVLLHAALCSAEFCSPCTSGLLSWCNALELQIYQLCNAVVSAVYFCVLIHVVHGITPSYRLNDNTLSFLDVKHFCKLHNMYVLCISLRNAWTMLVLYLAGVSPIVSEHRKQIDDLKKFKNDFRVSFSVC